MPWSKPATARHHGGRVAAATLALLGAGNIHFYLSGYDRALADISPGTILLGTMLEQAIAEGRREAHFLRGDEAYKFAFGAAARHNATRRLTAIP